MRVRVEEDVESGSESDEYGEDETREERSKGRGSEEGYTDERGDESEDGDALKEKDRNLATRGGDDREDDGDVMMLDSGITAIADAAPPATTTAAPAPDQPQAPSPWKQTAHRLAHHEYTFEAVHSPKRRRLEWPAESTTHAVPFERATAIASAEGQEQDDEREREEASDETEGDEDQDEDTREQYDRRRQVYILSSSPTPSHPPSPTAPTRPTTSRDTPARTNTTTVNAEASSRRFLLPRTRAAPPASTSSPSPIDLPPALLARPRQHLLHPAINTSPGQPPPPPLPARPTFILPPNQPSSPQSPTSITAPPPDILSPSARRGSTRYQPGGLAATLRTWVVDAGQAAAVGGTAGVGVAEGREPGLAFRLLVLRVRPWVGRDVVLVEGVVEDRSGEGREGLKRVLLAGKARAGAGANEEGGRSRQSVKQAQVQRDDVVAVKVPVWSIDIGKQGEGGDGTWTVCVDWTVSTP